MLVLNESTEHARDNIFAKDNIFASRRVTAVSGDNNQISGYAKKKLSALNREFLKSLGFVVRNT